MFPAYCTVTPKTPAPSNSLLVFFCFFPLGGGGGRIAGGGERRRISLTYLILTLKINISIYGGSKTLCHQNYVLLLLETDAPNTHNIIFHYCARQTAPACALQVWESSKTGLRLYIILNALLWRMILTQKGGVLFCFLIWVYVAYSDTYFYWSAIQRLALPDITVPG